MRILKPSHRLGWRIEEPVLEKDLAPFPGKSPTRITFLVEDRQAQPTIYMGKPSLQAVDLFYRAVNRPTARLAQYMEFDRKNVVSHFIWNCPIPWESNFRSLQTHRSYLVRHCANTNVLHRFYHPWLRNFLGGGRSFGPGDWLFCHRRTSFSWRGKTWWVYTHNDPSDTVGLTSHKTWLNQNFPKPKEPKPVVTNMSQTFEIPMQFQSSDIDWNSVQFVQNGNGSVTVTGNVAEPWEIPPIEDSEP
jgi:hypothetical protein